MTENLHNNNQSPMEYTPLNTGYGSFGVDHSQLDFYCFFYIITLLEEDLNDI
ncbi:MAG: hypothetical protein IJY58_06035 [Alphaproteobacteria bacterium]|nr:hypothetical protein [Alphaproteobacteria bacterium]